MLVKSQDVNNLVETGTSVIIADRDIQLTNRMEKYVKKIFDLRGPFENWISLMLWVMSISMDPLFFYIPVIKMDKNCLDLDTKLGIISCVFRSVIDLLYIIYIKTRPVMSDNSNSPYRSYKGYIDLLAVLPMPQVVIIIIIVSKMSPPKYLEALNVLKYFVLFQFVPRVIRTYQLFQSARILAEVTWVKVAFNLYLYMLSGHIFGALWYFFAIERNIECWKKAACIVKNQTRCDHQSFNCHKSSGNHKFLNVACSTKSQNTDFYDFGIYHDALQSGVVKGSFLQKFMYCFRWGLQSLSCFAQNLVTSIDIWENVFTISITISSVVLFTILIGNMQSDLQSAITRSENMKLKMREIEQWTIFKYLPGNLQREVKKYWKGTRHTDVKKLLNDLPKDVRMNIKRELCLKLIRRVPIFGILYEQPLNALCERLKHVLYQDETDILREGEPVYRMLFIIRGGMVCTSSNDRDRNLFDFEYLTEFCGEELSSWAIDPRSSSHQIPISNRTIKVHTEVEAFSLMADDLKGVFTKFWPPFPESHLHIVRYHSLWWRLRAACIIQVAWRNKLEELGYCQKKLEERKHEEEKKLQNALAAAEGSSISSVGGTKARRSRGAKALSAILSISKARKPT